MRTNSKVVRELVDKHILDCVYDENCDPYDNIADAATCLYKEFDRVANYPVNLQRIPNNQDRFIDFMCGLPFGFLVYYHEQNTFLNSLGINPENKQFTDERVMKMYYYLIYKQILKHKQ